MSRVGSLGMSTHANDMSLHKHTYRVMLWYYVWGQPATSDTDSINKRGVNHGVYSHQHVSKITHMRAKTQTHSDVKHGISICKHCIYQQFTEAAWKTQIKAFYEYLFV